MTLKLERFTDPKIFHQQIIDFLLTNEAENCLPIGLAKRLVDGGIAPSTPDDLARPHLWIVRDDQTIQCVAIQILKKLLIVTAAPQPAMEFLAQALVRDQVQDKWTGSSIHGVPPSLHTLVDRYAELTGKQKTIAAQLRLFQLDRVLPPQPAPGSMRLSTDADRSIIARFIAGFQIQTHQPSSEDPLVQADRAIAGGRCFVWEALQPVAMATFMGPTPNGIRIGGVYTPPEARGRGYASNLVAVLSQHLLDQGRRFCFLFTDQTNPTSNSIYQKIGYKPIADSERWDLM